MTTPEFATKSTAALIGSVKLANEVIGVMRLLDAGIKPTPGIVGALRRHLRAIEQWVDEVEAASR